MSIMHPKLATRSNSSPRYTAEYDPDGRNWVIYENARGYRDPFAFSYTEARARKIAAALNEQALTARRSSPASTYEGSGVTLN